MEFLKAEVLKTGQYKVLAIPFGGPMKSADGFGRDLDHDWFSQRTDPKPEWFPERPVIWHHGLDAIVGDALIGRQEQITKASDGWWGKLWLDKQNKYFAQIDAMIASGRMYGSSAALPHMIKKAANGEILVWPHVEQTLSPIPRNPYSVVRATKALDDYGSAGIEVHPGFAGIISELEALSTDLRYQTSAMGEDAAKAQSHKALNRVLDEAEEFLSRLR